MDHAVMIFVSDAEDVVLNEAAVATVDLRVVIVRNRQVSRDRVAAAAPVEVRSSSITAS